MGFLMLQLLTGLESPAESLESRHTTDMNILKLEVWILGGLSRIGEKETMIGQPWCFHLVAYVFQPRPSKPLTGREKGDRSPEKQLSTLHPGCGECCG
jgi:hypothetical protein